MSEQLCLCGCGQPVEEHQGKGRPGRYATPACRQRAFFQRRVDEQSASNNVKTKIKEVSVKRSGGVVNRAPFPYSRECLDYALSQVREGVLSIDENGFIWRHLANGKTITPRRAENVAGKGYLRVTFGMPGSRATHSVMAHRLVWEWAHGPIPEDKQINHMDGNKQNNRLGNLEIVTASQNMVHAYEHQRPHPWALRKQDPEATYRGRPLLSEEEKGQMRALAKEGWFLKDIAQQFGYSITHVQRIVTGEVEHDVVAQPARPLSTKRAGGKVNRAPFAYYGGKSYLVPTLLQVLPKHEVYCEVFGGSGVLLFNKEPARLEVFNDLHSGIVNLFRVLRAPESATELQRRLLLTPYSREEWRDCLETWQHEQDPIEKARRWFVVVQQSFSGHDRWAGWRFARAVGRNPAVSYRGATELLTTFTERLSHVEIEHADFGQVLATYDGPDTLFFCDPPYLPETRVKGKYQHEMGVDDHIRLLEQLQTLQGKVVLSGYDAPLYQRMLTGWTHLQQSISCHAAGRTRKSGLQGEGAVYAQEQTRVESIWLSPNIAQQPTLWAI